MLNAASFGLISDTAAKAGTAEATRTNAAPPKHASPVTRTIPSTSGLIPFNHRLRYGHWEADLVEARGKQRPLLVLIERKSRYVLSGFLNGKWSEEVARISKQLLQGFKVHSFTCDSGPEFANHQLIKNTLNCKLYYTHPYKSWQNGAVENVNKLIRDFFPKASSFSYLSKTLPQQATQQINSRPRRSLNTHTPHSLLKHLLINP